MASVCANGIQIAYDDVGGGPVVVLIMGIAAQRIMWPDPFVARLVDVGHRVIRLDNRDVGESTWLDGAPVPSPRTSLLRALAKRPIDAPYTLADMADDTVGLLDALGIERAHVLGASMGGMIAQQLAIQAPERLRSLISIMSGPGTLRHMIGHPRAIRALLRPGPTTRASAMEHHVAFFRTVGGALPLDEPALRERAGRMWDVGINPYGFARQWAAIMASGSRLEALRHVATPTRVIHGTHDPLVPPRAGQATAAAIPGATLTLVRGMGHAMPPASWPVVVPAILDHLRRHP